MRVLIDVRLLGKGGMSGIEEYTKKLVSHLLEIDAENDYLLFYSGWRKGPLPQAWLGRPNVKIIGWKYPNRLPLPPIELLVKTDIIFSPHINFLRHGVKTPRVLTIHDLSFIHHPYFFSKKHRLWHWLQNCRQQAEKAAVIITDSEFTKRDIIETLQAPQDKIRVVYPGVSLRQNSPDTNLRPTPEPYILYLGTIEPRKNVLAIIKAFNLLRVSLPISLVLAGRFGWLYKDVLAARNKSPWRQDIIFTGPVSEEQKTQFYKNASAFVFPSFFEGFGLPPLEAQLCGCPVIAGERTSLPEILGPSALFADPWRVNDLASQIKKILTDNQLKNKLVAAGYENVKRFSWEKTAREVLDIFKRFNI